MSSNKARNQRLMNFSSARGDHHQTADCEQKNFQNSTDLAEVYLIGKLKFELQLNDHTHLDILSAISKRFQ
jgi:hypothetical protein